MSEPYKKPKLIKVGTSRWESFFLWFLPAYQVDDFTGQGRYALIAKRMFGRIYVIGEIIRGGDDDGGGGLPIPVESYAAAA